MDHGTAQPQLVWSFLIFCLYLGGLGATLRIFGKNIGLACIIDMGDKEGKKRKTNHLVAAKSIRGSQIALERGLFLGYWVL